MKRTKKTNKQNFARRHSRRTGAGIHAADRNSDRRRSEGNLETTAEIWAGHLRAPGDQDPQKLLDGALVGYSTLNLRGTNKSS